MDLSIIIVNWRSVDLLRSCLCSIYREADGLEFETIVIDNGSFDGSAKLVAKEFPVVIFVQAMSNLGFGRANNLGATRSTGATLLFLNPDTEVKGTALQTLMSQLRGHPEVGIIGGKLLNSDGSIQESCVQAFPTITNQVLNSDFLRRRFRSWRLWGNAVLFSNPRTLVPVDMISGACLMIRRDVFEEIGQFNSELFMYADDLSLCYRAKSAGHEVCYVSDAEVVHHGGSSSARKEDKFFSTILQRQSLFRFFIDTRGRAYAFAYRLTCGIAASLRVLLISLVFPFWSVAGREETLVASLTKWARVFGWCVGFESWATSISLLQEDRGQVSYKTGDSHIAPDPLGENPLQH
jgi:N-acetylglucosaminyl-diphospho-decaprenol L-rhamnosyltransferase